MQEMQETGFSPWGGKIPWSRKWQPTSVFLPGKFHGQRSLDSYSPWGHKLSDRTEPVCACARTHTHTHTHTHVHTYRTLIVIFQKDMGGQQVHEMEFSITKHQGNANQNHSEVSPHTCKNGCYQKQTNKQKIIKK